MLREAFKGGPAYLTLDGVTYQMSEDWDAKFDIQRVERKTNLQGLVGHGLDAIICKLSFKPIATNVNLATLITKLHSRLASGRGSFLFGATDKPAVIQGKDGRALTFAAAAITKEPNVTFAPNKDLFDTVEVTALLATNGDSADITDYLTEGASAYVEPVLDPLSIISESYLLSWGEDAPFDAIETDENGIVLEPSLSWKDKKTQKDGLLNFQQDEKSAQVKFTPVNLSSADFLDLIPAVGRGRMLGSFGLPLVVTPVSGSGPKLTLPLAVPVDPQTRFGTESRIGEVLMLAQRSYESSTLKEPYTLEVVAPEEP